VQHQPPLIGVFANLETRKFDRQPSALEKITNSREKRLARVSPKLLDLMESRAELEDRALFVDVARIRKRTGLSQSLFARRFGFPGGDASSIFPPIRAEVTSDQLRA
jgi:DNA-binding transcriptional regulator YiaG